MMRTVFAGVLSITLGVGEAQAFLLNQGIGPDVIGPVSITLSDGADDACWTNLKEVREYAEEKLRSKGYSLSDDSKALVNYTIVVDVTAFRHNAAPTCVGAITVSLAKFTSENEIGGLHVIHMNNVVATSSLNRNLNNRVIEQIRELIDGM